MVSGTGFLLVDREISHRNNLSSTKWTLAEQAKQQFATMAKDANLAEYIPKDTTGPNVQNFASEAVTRWNDAVAEVRDFLGGGGSQ